MNDHVAWNRLQHFSFEHFIGDSWLPIIIVHIVCERQRNLPTLWASIEAALRCMSLACSRLYVAWLCARLLGQHFEFYNFLARKLWWRVDGGKWVVGLRRWNAPVQLDNMQCMLSEMFYSPLFSWLFTLLASFTSQFIFLRVFFCSVAARVELYIRKARHSLTV